MKHIYPTKNQEIKQYWVVEVQDYHDFDNFQDAYEQIGLKTKYIELNIPGYFACFYIGKKPSKFIKDFEFDINGRNLA